MPYQDVTQALLHELARHYPRSVRTADLATSVSCEPEALQRHLRLLRETGALRVLEGGRPGQAEDEVLAASITEEALRLVRRRAAKEPPAGSASS